MTDKARRVDAALLQLAQEISCDERYDTPSAICLCADIDSIVAEASPASKARLFDLLRGG